MDQKRRQRIERAKEEHRTATREDNRWKSD
ncbi:hypothetical protein COLO4_05965 [Corchorus olitorius]|uniref:Uncharacterized protein n=1 Tax=Corchorus olitorius TaxID=93759 RepID=A0A1R3KPC1_9ROSI|nr:hypothetical protein COLO4_05965 [Corchorus olitorius]